MGEMGRLLSLVAYKYIVYESLKGWHITISINADRDTF